MKRAPRWAPVVLLLAQAALCPAEDPAAMLRGASLFGRDPELAVRVTMEIHAPGGVKVRELEAFLRQPAASAAGPVDLLMRVTAPAFLTDLAYLSRRDSDGSESRWLKTSRGVRRLSQSERAQSLFDSDFMVQDVSSYDVEDYELRSRGAEAIEGVRCSVIEATPRVGSSERKVIWLDPAAGLLRRVDVFDVRGTLARRYLLAEAQLVGSGLYPLRCTMETPAAKTHTVLLFRSIRVDQKLPDKLFSRGNL